LNVNDAGLAVNVPEVVAGFTVRETVVEWVRLPEVPVMVRPTVRLAAELLADSVSVLLPVELIGLKDAVTPVGKPGGVKPTVLLLKPPDGVDRNRARAAGALCDRHAARRWPTG